MKSIQLAYAGILTAFLFSLAQIVPFNLVTPEKVFNALFDIVRAVAQ